jgi:undecaprenyl-diphosphatase
LQNLNIRKIGIDDYSFPSGHTTAAFCIAVMIALTIPHLSVIAISIAIAVGISRMYLGVHFPSDVLVGMLLGSITSLSVFLLM